MKNLLTTGPFNQHNTRYGYDIWFARGLTFFIGTVPIMALCTLLAAITPWLIILGVLLGGIAIYWIPQLGKLHPLGRIPKFVDSSSYYSSPTLNPLYDLAEEYLELPKEDRRQFPSNFMEVLANPDLTEGQRNNLIGSTRKTIRLIEERNQAKQVIAKRNTDTDITPILEYMHDQRESLKVERDTYREFNETGTLPRV